MLLKGWKHALSSTVCTHCHVLAIIRPPSSSQADEELGQIKGLDHLLSQVSDVARDLAIREDNDLGGMRSGASAVTSKGNSKSSRSRPWAEGAAPDQLRRAAALRRKEDIVRYGKKKEGARRVWSTVRGCYVAVDDAGTRADGAQFAF
jgi:hypothetical protein